MLARGRCGATRQADALAPAGAVPCAWSLRRRSSRHWARQRAGTCGPDCTAALRDDGTAPALDLCPRRTGARPHERTHALLRGRPRAWWARSAPAGGICAAAATPRASPRRWAAPRRRAVAGRGYQGSGAGRRSGPRSPHAATPERRSPRRVVPPDDRHGRPQGSPLRAGHPVGAPLAGAHDHPQVAAHGAPRHRPGGAGLRRARIAPPCGLGARAIP
jgi:hypothetical protein